MSTFDSILAGIMIFLTVLGVLATFYSVDRPRKPITPGTALSSLVLSAITLYLLIKAYF